jgi:hypothetical protein
MQWDASYFISDTVVSHHAVSPVITNHSDSGSLSSHKYQNFLFFSRGQAWLTFPISTISQYQ